MRELISKNYKKSKQFYFFKLRQEKRHTPVIADFKFQFSLGLII